MTTTSQRLATPVDSLTRIASGVSDFVDRQLATAPVYGTHYARLWQLTAQTVVGGKMVRPRLMIDATTALVADAPGPGIDEDTVVNAAVAIELLHYAFVLHDDVIDGDLVRRGRPNLVAAVAAEHPHGAMDSTNARAHLGGADPALHLGHTAAILMGDLFLSGMYQTIARLDVPPAARDRLFAIVDHTIGETVAGEYVDVALADGAIEPELATIVGMAANKTAAYSFELPLRTAAVLAGAPLAVEDELARVVRHLGLAFQLQDDLLSVFGDPARHGKDPNSDLREGKETALMAFARMTSAWAEISPLVGREDLSDRDAERVRAALEECGARRFVDGLVDDSLDAFREGCRPSRFISSRVARVLLAAADALEERQS